MSILPALAAAATTTSATVPPTDAGDDRGMLLILLAFTALALTIASRLHVLRPQTVVGPKRLPDRGGMGPLLIVLFLALCVWFLAQGIYAQHRIAQLKAAGVEHPEKQLESLLTPRDYALLSTVPPMLGFVVIVGAWSVLGLEWLRRLGLELRRLAAGVGAGIVGMLVVGPAVLWTMLISGVVYQRLHYEHPSEHVLLKSLGEAQSGKATILILIGATLCAPLFEELLFRGHVQTLIRQLLMRLSPPLVLPAPPPPPESLEPTPFAAALTPPPPPPFALPPTLLLQPRAWHGWVAIVITALVFALFHPAWSWPAIFVLALGLGYVYERTGNLWAPITVHLLFNSMETVQYLMLMRGH